MTDQAELLAIRSRVALAGRLSDSLIRIGPWGLGLEGVLSWVPGLGEIYGAGAAAFILWQGAKAKVPTGTLIVAAAMMGARTVISAIPLAGPIAADIFTTHRAAARLIVNAIDRQLGVPAEAAPVALRPRPPLWRSFRQPRDAGLTDATL
ncbi:MAG TPA: DUF4112 domain-containing protein [Caulobacteraceae bacterium]|nr:DUF4112 domain-containing protein [Caulobacteraceae bacterium]